MGKKDREGTKKDRAGTNKIEQFDGLASRTKEGTEPASRPLHPSTGD